MQTIRQGVLVHCSQETEGLLPWWWKQYRKSNHYPVAFVDCGLTAAGREWCLRRGVLIYGERRQPVAMLRSPFAKTIWLTLSCEVIGSLAPLFGKAHALSGFGATLSSEKEFVYDTDVLVYEQNSLLVRLWHQACLQPQAHLFTDAELLSLLIQTEEIEVAEIPLKYRWRFEEGVNLEAVILHWTGPWADKVLSSMGGHGSHSCDSG